MQNATLPVLLADFMSSEKQKARHVQFTKCLAGQQALWQAGNVL
jgi:hypothetical protein